MTKSRSLKNIEKTAKKPPLMEGNGRFYTVKEFVSLMIINRLANSES